MTHYGKIESYDSGKGAGMIAPENGGTALSFKKADLQKQGRVPAVNQRYGYDTTEANGGGKRAINLREQSESQSQIYERQAREQRG